MLSSVARKIDSKHETTTFEFNGFESFVLSVSLVLNRVSARLDCILSARVVCLSSRIVYYQSMAKCHRKVIQTDWKWFEKSKKNIITTAKPCSNRNSHVITSFSSLLFNNPVLSEFVRTSFHCCASKKSLKAKERKRKEIRIDRWWNFGQ